MSILDAIGFGQKSQQSAPQNPAPQNPGQSTQQQQQQPIPGMPNQNPQPKPAEPAFQQSNNTDPKPADPGTGPAQDPNKQTSPLDVFDNLFDTEPKKDGDPEPEKDFFSYNPENLAKSVQKLSFVDAAQMEELGAKALQGDTQALTQLLNNMGQQIYAQAAELSVGVANHASRASYDRAIADVPTSVRSISASDTLSGLNPQYKHKALRPLVDHARAQVELKFPNASPQEIAEMTNSYMKAAFSATEVSDTDPTRRPTQNSQQPPQPQNFSDFFSNSGRR